MFGSEPFASQAGAGRVRALKSAATSTNPDVVFRHMKPLLGIGVVTIESNAVAGAIVAADVNEGARHAQARQFVASQGVSADMTLPVEAQAPETSQLLAEGFT